MGDQLLYTSDMRDPYFPFHALGFRSNPFRALADEEWAAIVVLPESVTRAAAQGVHLQVVGEMGRGKTSTLLGLARQMRQAGHRVTYEYIADGQDTFRSQLAGLEVFLLDEAQRLRPAKRRRLLSSAARGVRLVLGSHDDLRPLFYNAGLSLDSVQLGSEGVTHLGLILGRRLDYFAFNPSGQPGVTFSASAVQYLAGTFGGDLRAMERFLYEVFQSLPAPGVLTEEQLRAQPASIAAKPRR